VYQIVIHLQGYASGSFGPTTAGRMDSYVDLFQAAGGSMIMLAKGNRSKQVSQGLLVLVFIVKDGFPIFMLDIFMFYSKLFPAA